MWAHVSVARQKGLLPIIPAAVLAQCWRDGAKQANVARLLKIATVVSLDLRAAIRTGELCARSGTSDIVDASLVVAAIEHQGVILTADVRDIALLIEASDHDIAIIRL